MQRLAEYRTGPDVGGLGVYSQPAHPDRLRHRRTSQLDEHDLWTKTTNPTGAASHPVCIGPCHQAVLPAHGTEGFQCRADVLIDDPVGDEMRALRRRRFDPVADVFGEGGQAFDVSHVPRWTGLPSSMSHSNVRTMLRSLVTDRRSSPRPSFPVWSGDVECASSTLVRAHALVSLVSKGDYVNAERMASKISGTGRA